MKEIIEKKEKITIEFNEADLKMLKDITHFSKTIPRLLLEKKKRNFYDVESFLNQLRFIVA